MGNKTTTIKYGLCISAAFLLGFGVARITTPTPLTPLLDEDKHITANQQTECADIDLSSIVQPPKSAQFTDSLAPQETLQPQLQSLEKTTLPDSQPNEPTFTLAEIESQQRAQAEIDAHIARISQTKNLASINSELEKEFDNEAIDYDWAAEHEDTLTEVFYTEESLAQYAVNNIECKTTKCKINFPASDIAQANEISEKFTQALMNSDAGKDGFGVIISPDSTGGVNMFINRSGR